MFVGSREEEHVPGFDEAREVFGYLVGGDVGE